MESRGSFPCCGGIREVEKPLCSSCDDEEVPGLSNYDFYDALTSKAEDGRLQEELLSPIPTDHSANLQEEQPLAIEYDVSIYDPRDTILEPAWIYSDEDNLQIVPVEEPPLTLSEVSLWVLCQMQAISHFLGLSFEGVEQQAIELFTALEKEISNSRSEMNNRCVRRELQSLQSEFKRGMVAS